MKILECYTSLIKLPPKHIISSYCVPILGSAEREVFKIRVPAVELEVARIYRLLTAISHVNTKETQGFLDVFGKIKIFTSQKSVIRALKKESGIISESTHRILTELRRIMKNGLYDTPVSIVYIAQKQNLAYKRIVDIPFKEMIQGGISDFND